MFKLEDFWDIFNYLNGDTDVDLDPILESIAQSEYGKTSNLFSNIIDQNAFDSDDYRRLRKFLINWYSSLKVISKVQEEVTDPFSLPSEHTDELFRSFGYNYSSSIISTNPTVNDTKVNFFLDLVNLYKKKGTPRGMIEVLQYYGLRDFDLLEFWLQRDPNLNLIFKGEPIESTYTTMSRADEIILPFGAVTEGDPHWLLSETNIRNMLNLGSLRLPVKSPYFALRPRYDFYVGVSIFSRKIQDEFNQYQDIGSITSTETASIPLLGISSCSILELYLSIIYLYNRLFGPTGFESSDTDRFLCYDGTNILYADILDEYNNLILSPPSSRADKELKRNQYYDIFTRARASNFFKGINAASTYLGQINPSLKTSINTYITAGKDYELFLSLLRDFERWSRDYMRYNFINIIYLILGIDVIIKDLENIVNFFKPYRARRLDMELLVLANNRILDSIYSEDEFDNIDVNFTFVDWATSDSQPCYGDSTAIVPILYSRRTFDCGSLFDIGCAWDEEPLINMEQTIEDDYISWDSTAIIPIDSTSVFSGEIIDSSANIILYYQMGGAPSDIYLYNGYHVFGNELVTDGAFVYTYNAATIIDDTFAADTWAKSGGEWTHSVPLGAYVCDGSQAGNTYVTKAAILLNGGYYSIYFSTSNVAAGHYSIILGTLAWGDFTTDGDVSGFEKSDDVDLRFRGDLDFVGRFLNIRIRRYDFTNWTQGTGWFPGPLYADAIAGVESDIEQSLSIEANKWYEIVYTVTSYGGAGTLIPELGSVQGVSINEDGTYTDHIYTSDTGNLKFTKSLDFSGRLDNVSVKECNPQHVSSSGFPIGPFPGDITEITWDWGVWDGILGWWWMTEMSGFIAYDSSFYETGYENDGEIITQDSTNANLWVFSDGYNWLNFEKELETRVNIGNSHPIHEIGVDFAISCMMKASATCVSYARIFSYSSDATHFVRVYKHNVGNRMAIVVRNGAVWTLDSFDDSTPFDGLIHRVVLNFNLSQSEVNMFIDGVKDSLTISIPGITDAIFSADKYWGGEAGGTYPYDGLLRDCRIYGDILEDDIAIFISNDF